MKKALVIVSGVGVLVVAAINSPIGQLAAALRRR
jgi:hypothetical protein